MKITLKDAASIATTVLTALGACYAGIANIWGLPYADKVVATLAVAVALISAILGSFTIKKVTAGSTEVTANEVPEVETNGDEADDTDADDELAAPVGKNK